MPEETYSTWKNFRLRVLDPAIKQIYDDPYGAGFSVEYIPIRKGRFYHEIVFQLTKTAKRIQTDSLIKRNAGDARKIKATPQKVGRSVRSVRFDWKWKSIDAARVTDEENARHRSARGKTGDGSAPPLTDDEAAKVEERERWQNWQRENSGSTYGQYLDWKKAQGL